MEIIVGPRYSGKTTKLINLAKDNKIDIVVGHRCFADWINRQLNITNNSTNNNNITKALCFYDLQKNKLKSLQESKVHKVYIDDFDSFMAVAFGIKVEGVVISEYSIIKCKEIK